VPPRPPRGVECIEGTSRVRDRDLEPRIHQRGRDPNFAGLRIGLDAVPHRVFDQRLQQQRRHEHGAGAFVAGDRETQAIVKTNLLDLEIVANGLELGIERHEPLVQTIEHRVEQRGQPRHHVLRLRGVVLDEREDRIERVEQEVRLQLRLDGHELRFASRHLENGLPLPPLCLAIESLQHQSQPEPGGVGGGG
jgi:hypothetical protein